MIEPDFCESQFQEVVNCAIIRIVHKTKKKWIFPHVLSLPEEYYHGWDTGFYLSWLPAPPNPAQQGCNFFIQYKLSNEYTSKNAGQWSYWKAPYFRFKIPHNQNDYHQLKDLKAIAKNNYPTFYATNSTLLKSDLKTQFIEGTLLDNVRLLDINKKNVNKTHKYVTFVLGKKKFGLHSEAERVNASSITDVFHALERIETLTLDECNARLAGVLHQHANKQQYTHWLKDLNKINETLAQIDDKQKPLMHFYALKAFVFWHIGACLFWVAQ